MNDYVFVSEMRRNILKHYTKLVDEIEPTKLRDKLVQEGVFKSKEWADMYKTATRRRERAVVLVRNLFRKDDKALPVFADALLIGQYDEIAKDITNSEGSVYCLSFDILCVTFLAQFQAFAQL